MSSSSAELTLILRAQNLANAAVGNLKTAVAEVGAKAETAGAQLSAAFAGKGAILARELGNLTVALLNGQDFMSAGLMLGSTLAGGLVTAFGEKVIATITGSALFATISGALTAAGTAIGGFVAAAIPVGMAALPFLLVAALVAAIAFLVTHPDVAGKILEVAGSIVKGIIGGLAELGGKLLGVFLDAFVAINTGINTFIAGVVGFFLSIPGKLVDLGGSIVTTIIGGLASLPGKIADVVRSAFANLKIDVGPFHITGAGITIDLPDISGGGKYGNTPTGFVPHPHAAGGWVGLNGPELGWLGEQGPEYIVPNGQLGGLGGTVEVHSHLYLDGRQIAEAVEAQQYRIAQRIPARVG